jgi:hypothetical protein
MTTQLHTAITLLDSLPGTKPYRWLARYWAWIALAEEQQEDPVQAAQSYCQAIHWGRQAIGTRGERVSQQELDRWQQAFERLSPGGVCDES